MIKIVLTKCPLKSRIHASIQKQLAPFKDGISEEMLNSDLVFNEVGSYLKEVKIQDHKMTHNPPLVSTQIQ